MVSRWTLNTTVGRFLVNISGVSVRDPDKRESYVLDQSKVCTRGWGFKESKDLISAKGTVCLVCDTLEIFCIPFVPQ